MLRNTAAAWLDQARLATLVEVASARGSIPRGPGTRMLVGATEIIGTIGGGRLEFEAIAHARSLLADDGAASHCIDYPLGPRLGQCCGGAVTLRFERLSARHLEDWPPPEPRFHLQLYGAGHVGRAIAQLLAALEVSVDWIDEREAEFPARLAGRDDWPPHIRKLAVDAVEAEVALAPPGAFYLVLTHQHALDQRIAEAILRRGDFGFFGLIGSRTKHRKFLHRLAERGVGQAVLSRMTCPIGLPGIDGKEPEVIAVSAVAQLLMQPVASRPGGSPAP